MKQQRFNIDFTCSKIVRFMGVSLVIALQLCLSGCTAHLSGCATLDTLDLAKIKASPANCDYLNLTSVRAAVEHENGDLSLCVELNDSNEIKSASYTFTLPLSFLAEDATAIDKLGFRPSLSSPMACYWYPIEKATRGCVVSNPEPKSPEALLPIERLTVSPKDKFQLADIISTLKREPDATKTLYEVTFIEEEGEVGLYSYDRATGKMVFVQAKENKEVVLVYYSFQAARKGIEPLIIAGGYRDKQTNLYYLLVPPAFALDAALIPTAVGIGVGIMGLSAYGGGLGF